MTILQESGVQDELVKIAAPEDLAAFLRANAIDLSTWNGQNGTKTVEDFWKELVEGEAQLAKGIRGEALAIIRKISPSGAWVYHFPAQASGLYLRETYVEDKATGAKKDRQRSYSLGEKAKPGETHREAIIRGIREELGVTGELAVFDAAKSAREEQSPSFPGLLTRYEEQKFNVALTADQFIPTGYVEEQKKKCIRFEWEATTKTRDEIMAVTA